MDPIVTLYDEAGGAGGEGGLSTASTELEKVYGGSLSFPVLPLDGADERKPYVITNFVSSLDGIVSYRIPNHASGAEIGGFNEADRFIMALLRVFADAVILGATTLVSEAQQPFTAEALYPEAQNELKDLRQRLGKRPFPLAVILSADGQMDLSHPTFQTPGIETVVFTNDTGSSKLEQGVAGLPGTHVIAMGGGGLVKPDAVLRVLHETWDVKFCLHEGGPEALGYFLQAGLVDELFLTISPRIAGQDREHRRPTLAHTLSFDPDTSPRASLISLKRQESHLFCRYRLKGQVISHQ